MNLGCLDFGCVSLDDENQKKNSSSESRSSDSSDSLSATAKLAKNKSHKEKEGSPTGGSTLNRVASQIKKPLHRKMSPLNWFPRQKGDSYLKRKIKLLQEAGGMNDTLDETLGHSNPHYCRVEREKMAARAAACKVMEAWKAAMVEASWCRILQAARIPHKEAEALLLKAEKEVTEAFEAATANGVTMYDTPDRPLKRFEIEISSASGKGSTTHAVRASFETAFEVDKQVAAAVKTAFIRLAHCSSFNKDEFKDLLRKISENPDSQELSESDTGLELETITTQDDGSNSQRRNRKKKQSPQKFSGTKLVNMMLERLKCLKEEELASLAIIVATCGLNAALSDSDRHIVQDRSYFMNTDIKQKQEEPELTSLDKFLVKKMTKLEKEVQEAKNARKAESKKDEEQVSASSESELGSVLVKHSSKLEKEVEEAKRSRNLSETNSLKSGKWRQLKQEDTEVLSLDKVLVKHVSSLEKEVEEAKKENTNSLNINRYKRHQGKQNKGECEGLDKVLVKHVSKLEKEKMRVDSKEVVEVKRRNVEPNTDTSGGGLDQILVKHKSRLQREKTGVPTQGGEDRYTYSSTKSRREARDKELLETWGDQILVKHKSKLEREKTGVSTQGGEDRYTYSSTKSRREARDKELLETWGGVGLGNSMRPHLSRLQRDKAAWIKAEEEEKQSVLQEHHSSRVV